MFYDGLQLIRNRKVYQNSIRIYFKTTYFQLSYVLGNKHFAMFEKNLALMFNNVSHFKHFVQVSVFEKNSGKGGIT